MAIRKTIKKSTDYTNPFTKPEEARFIGTRPGKYSLGDNSEKTNKELAEKRAKENAARGKKDAKSQKRGLKAANKPLKNTPARAEAIRLAGQRAKEARKKYIARTGPQLTPAQRIARDRVTGMGIPNPPSRLKKIDNALNKLGDNLERSSARNAEFKAKKKASKAAGDLSSKKRKPSTPAKPKGRGGRGLGGIGGGGGLFGGRGLGGTR